MGAAADDGYYRYNLLFLAATAGVTTGETGGSVVDLTRMGLSASINGQELAVVLLVVVVPSSVANVIMVVVVVVITAAVVGA